METKLVPNLLIAAPSMQDPRFKGAVILLVKATKEGALGFVLNKNSPFTFSDLGGELKSASESSFANDSIQYGGPVSPERGWILFMNEDEHKDPEMIQIVDDICITSTFDVLHQLIEKKTQGPFKLLLGYAGWDEKQLISELENGVWLPVDVDKKLLFFTPISEIWNAAIRKLGLEPGSFMIMPGVSS